MSLHLTDMAEQVLQGSNGTSSQTYSGSSSLNKSCGEIGPHEDSLQQTLRKNGYIDPYAEHNRAEVIVPENIKMMNPDRHIQGENAKESDKWSLSQEKASQHSGATPSVLRLLLQQPPKSVAGVASTTGHEIRSPDDCSSNKLNSESTRSSGLTQVRSMFTGKKLYLCGICGKAFEIQYHLLAHRVSHTGQKPHKCNICGMAFLEKSKLIRHSRIHTGEKPYGCGLCGSDFTQRYMLLRHLMKQHGEKPFTSRLSKIESLQDNNSPEPERQAKRNFHKCDVCGKLICSKANLKLHLKVHSGYPEGKPFRCDVCGATFTSKNSLKVHTLMHTGEKPYMCEICGSKFITNSSLSEHKKIHAGYKAYICETCGASFLTGSKLTKHNRIHTGEKPFKCGICGAAFSYDGNLRCHMRTHTGEKPFKCVVCTAAFCRRRNLILHQKKHEQTSAEQL